MPRTKTVVKLKRSSTKQTKKPTRQKKSAVDKINSTLAKHQDAEVIKLKTSDYLDYLAFRLENVADLYHTSDFGQIRVLPKKPKELLNTIKYLKKQAVKV